jgi:hypothetical protein
MLLTEWHPRALHFPPGDDAHELVIKETRNISRFNTENADGDSGSNERRTFEGIGGRRIENWLEPAWRRFAASSLDVPARILITAAIECVGCFLAMPSPYLSSLGCLMT